MEVDEKITKMLDIMYEIVLRIDAANNCLEPGIAKLYREIKELRDTPIEGKYVSDITKTGPR